MMRDYVAVTYDAKPFTDYPRKLAGYLCQRFDIKQGSTLLDVGCGRGEYTQGFWYHGVDAYGVDTSEYAKDTLGDRYRQTDLDLAGLYGGGTSCVKPDSVDVVLLKSVIEHLEYPEDVLTDIYRVLKLHGLILVLTPDWRNSYKGWYGDFQHKSPFMMTSLRDILLVVGYDDVTVEDFRQVPELWDRPIRLALCKALAAMMPGPIRNRLPMLAFTHAKMLFGYGRKPGGMAKQNVCPMSMV